MVRLRLAPELITESWLNTDTEPSLSSLQGSVVIIYAFQMLCRGCVEHSIPQAKRLHQLFTGKPAQVLGLHSVFEHHAAMSNVSLTAFLHEYEVKFPVAVDRPAVQGSIPQTMQCYQLQGTPTLLLIDRQGYLRRQSFGLLDDIQLGAEVMSLLLEDQPEHPFAATDSGRGCKPAAD